MHDNKVSTRIVEALKEKRIRVTRQRMVIIRIISEDRDHPGVRAIFTQAREKLPDISLSTVYYTLGLLKKEGLIKELEFYDMENRYDAETTDHIDLICTECGDIANFERDLSVARHVVEESTGFWTHGVRFEYYGVCAACRGVKR